MANFKNEYESKLISAEKATETVKSGDWVDFGWGVGVPVDLDKALAKRITEEDLTDLKFRGGIVLRVPEIFKIEDAPKHLCWNSWHMTGIERKAIAQGIAYYAPIRYSELPRYYRDLPDPVDVAMFRVSPMDEEGYFNFGPSASHMADMCSRAKCIVVEVNENMPVALGGNPGGEKIHISQIDHIVESSNTAMEELPAGPTSEIDEKVAQLIVEEIPNGACLQLGIGGMPNAVGSLIAGSDLKNLGVHTEMYVDAFVDIAMAGKINGSCKTVDPGRQAYAFGAGTQKLYDYINNNPECMSAPVDYTNDIRVVSSIDNQAYQRRGRPAGLCAGSVSVQRRKELYLLLLYLYRQGRQCKIQNKADTDGRLHRDRYQDQHSLCSDGIRQSHPEGADYMGESRSSHLHSPS